MTRRIPQELVVRKPSDKSVPTGRVIKQHQMQLTDELR